MICTRPLKDAPRDGEKQVAIPKAENPEREQNPEAAKRQKNQAVMAGIMQNAELSPEQYESIFKTLGLQSASMKAF